MELFFANKESNTPSCMYCDNYTLKVRCLYPNQTRYQCVKCKKFMLSLNPEPTLIKHKPYILVKVKK